MKNKILVTGENFFISRHSLLHEAMAQHFDTIDYLSAGDFYESKLNKAFMIALYNITKLSIFRRKSARAFKI